MALLVRDQHRLLWLVAGDIVTTPLASALVYGRLPVDQRRLSRLIEYGLLRGFRTASAQRPRGPVRRDPRSVSGQVLRRPVDFA